MEIPASKSEPNSRTQSFLPKRHENWNSADRQSDE